MPRFFLPGLEDNPELAEETYRALRIFARDKTLSKIEPDRVYALTYRHDGAEHRVATPAHRVRPHPGG